MLVLIAVAGRRRILLVSARIPSSAPSRSKPCSRRVESSNGPNAGTPILTASGYLVARQQSVVSSKIQGRISELRVEEGSVVKAGEVLATLDNQDALAAIAKAKADIDYAKADLAEAQRQERLQEDLYQRQSRLAGRARRGQVQGQSGAAAIEQDEANLQVQQAYLDFTTVRAPFAGIVVKKMTEAGESVAPIPPGVNISTSSGAIVAIADMNSLEAEVDVNESNVGQLQPNQPADIRCRRFPDHTYKGVLRQVIPTADRTKATVTVKVSILDKDKYLRPEMSCNVTFLAAADTRRRKTRRRSAIITVPKDAVITRDGKPVGFRDRGQQGARAAGVPAPICTGRSS